MRQRDPFADFARMRREMDQLLGDVWERRGYASGHEHGYAPRVDVYYCGEPRKAVVKVELPGVDLEAVQLEIRGRALAISGKRPVRETEGRTYQQVELPSGTFRRIVELGSDVVADEASATYEDGVLRIELPLRAESTQQVPIERTED
jgi:HSP20 family protein